MTSSGSGTGGSLPFGEAVNAVLPLADALYVFGESGLYRRSLDGAQEQLATWTFLSEITYNARAYDTSWSVAAVSSQFTYLEAGQWKPVLNAGCPTFAQGELYSTSDWGAGLGTHRWNPDSADWTRIGDSEEFCFHADAESGATIGGKLLRTVVRNDLSKLMISDIQTIAWSEVTEMTPILTSLANFWFLHTPWMTEPDRLWLVPQFEGPLYSSPDGVTRQSHEPVSNPQLVGTTIVTYEGETILAPDDSRLLVERDGTWEDFERTGLAPDATSLRVFTWNATLGVASSAGLYAWNGTSWEFL